MKNSNFKINFLGFTGSILFFAYGYIVLNPEPENENIKNQYLGYFLLVLSFSSLLTPLLKNYWKAHSVLNKIAMSKHRTKADLTIIVFFGFLLYRLTFLNLNPNSVNCERLKTINGVVSKAPFKSKRDYGPTSIDFKLEPYPNSIFSCITYDKLETNNFLTDVDYSDSIQITTRSNMYTHSNIGNVVVYSVFANGKEYLTCTDHNENWYSTDRSLIFIEIAISIFFYYFILYRTLLAIKHECISDTDE